MHFHLRSLLAIGVTGCALLTACTDHTELLPDSGDNSNFSIPVPRAILRARIDPSELDLTITANGETVPTTESDDNSDRTGTMRVPFGESIQISIRWSINGTEIAILDSVLPPVESNREVRFTSNDYTILNNDGDNFTNIEELEAEPPTDINDPNSFPNDVLDPPQTGVPQYLTGDCGSVPIESALASTEGGNPTTIAVNTIVAARIDPDTISNVEHFWNIPVSAGFYHLIVDSTRVDNRDAFIGLRISDRDLENTASGNLIGGFDIDRRLRKHRFFEVPEATTLRLRVSPTSGAEDYQLALFANGLSIPVPYLTDCPAVGFLSVGTTQRVELPGGTRVMGDQWFTIDANAVDHLVSVFATRVDANGSFIDYRVSAFDQLAQRSRQEILISGLVIGVSSDASGIWPVTEAVNRWIRIRNRRDDALSLDVLVSENEN